MEHKDVLSAARCIELTAFEAAMRAALALNSDTEMSRRQNLEDLKAASEKVSTALASLEFSGDLPASSAHLSDTALKQASGFVEKLAHIAGMAETGDPSSIDIKPLQELCDFTAADLRQTMSALIETLEKGQSEQKEHDSNSSREARAVIDSAVDEIDQISLNVRLISLNASVEAARAGEAGKGFGVIAAEIQNLATRSQGAVESVRRQLASIG